MKLGEVTLDAIVNKLREIAGMDLSNDMETIVGDFDEEDFPGGENIFKTMSDKGLKDDLFATNIETYLNKHSIPYSHGSQHRVFKMRSEDLVVMLLCD